MQNSRFYKEGTFAIPTPAYVVYEDRLRKNLEKLQAIRDETGITLIMALKANALWKTFPIIREYFTSATASSLNEMQLAADYLGGEIHAYCPVYTNESFPKFLEKCSHITFNTLSQFEKFKKEAYDFETSTGRHISLGLRANPKCSVIDHDIYNPAIPGSRFGMSAGQLPDSLPNEIEGLHFHSLCESGSEDLEKVLNKFEEDFGRYLPNLKWVNFGGGHLITRKDYDIELLKRVIKDFKERYPNLTVIMEPGSAFTWQTGDLLVKILDIVEDEGIKTAIIDASFACHMPDCLEMPYKPAILESIPDENEAGFEYRLGGNTCLTGDFVGDWKFDKPLQTGDRLTLLDMNHYTTVKTNMFNGVDHPSVWLVKSDGTMELLRKFGYEDYRDRMN